jgi:hypothetical protein
VNSEILDELHSFYVSAGTLGDLPLASVDHRGHILALTLNIHSVLVSFKATDQSLWHVIICNNLLHRYSRDQVR